MKKIIGLLIIAIICAGIAFGMNQSHKVIALSNDKIEQGTDNDNNNKDNNNKDNKVKADLKEKDNLDKNKTKGNDNAKIDSNSKEKIEKNKNQDLKNQSPANKNSDSKSENNAITDNKKTKTAIKQDKQETVTISINDHKAIQKGVNKKSGFTHLSPSGVILKTTKVNIKKGDTVYDVLAKVVRENKIQMEYTGTGKAIYIQGIDNLYEFDGGRYSGWMYEVNGIYPNYGVGAYSLKSGDKIIFNYTCDLGRDLGVPIPTN